MKLKTGREQQIGHTKGSWIESLMFLAHLDVFYYLLVYRSMQHGMYFFFTPIMSTTISIQSKAYMWEGLRKILIRGLLADPIPNSPNYYHKNCVVESKENY